jgi:SAM-dependent methyltransferase
MKILTKWHNLLRRLAVSSDFLKLVATNENFDEVAYLLANPDVADAVKKKQIKSGRVHFEVFGKNEGRHIKSSDSIILEAKKEKLKKIKPLLRTDMLYTEQTTYYDFLNEELRSQFNIVDTNAVSSNGYDAYAMALIEKNKDGLVLDCGAGKRPVYFDNVVNFEIVDYETTDVRGVGEVLPFIDGAFDAVLSMAVLEHVKDPFLCAKEISRVLKKNGELICCVPFLQPEHGKSMVYGSVLPISSLTWILQSWSAGLSGQAKDDFMQMKVADLMGSIDQYLGMPFVKELSEEKNFELASATVLFAHK